MIRQHHEAPTRVVLPYDSETDPFQMPPPPKWFLQAECWGQNPDWFFPAGDQDNAAPEGVAICGRCAVSQDCLDFAIENNLAYGLWGGKTPVERRKIEVLERKSDNPLGLSVTDAAAVLGVNRRTLSIYVQRRQVTFNDDGKQRYIPDLELAAQELAEIEQRKSRRKKTEPLPETQDETTLNNGSQTQVRG